MTPPNSNQPTLVDAKCKLSTNPVTSTQLHSVLTSSIPYTPTVSKQTLTPPSNYSPKEVQSLPDICEPKTSSILWSNLNYVDGSESSSSASETRLLNSKVQPSQPYYARYTDGPCNQPASNESRRHNANTFAGFISDQIGESSPSSDPTLRYGHAVKLDTYPGSVEYPRGNAYSNSSYFSCQSNAHLENGSMSAGSNYNCDYNKLTTPSTANHSMYEPTHFPVDGNTRNMDSQSSYQYNSYDVNSKYLASYYGSQNKSMDNSLGSEYNAIALKHSTNAYAMSPLVTGNQSYFDAANTTPIASSPNNIVPQAKMSADQDLSYNKDTGGCYESTSYGNYGGYYSSANHHHHYDNFPNDISPEYYQLS